MALLYREMIQATQAEPSRSLEVIPEGVAGISATLDKMVALTKSYKLHPMVRDLAEQIITALPPKNPWAEVDAVKDWVSRNIRYTGDIGDLEHIKTPDALLVDRFGDCDDMALLAGTLLKSIGYAVRYVAVASGDYADYSHVYLEVKIGARWVGIETTENVPLGWRPPSNIPPMVRHV